MLRLLAAAPAAAGFAWTEAEAQQAHTHAQAAQTAARTTGTAFKPKFFNAQEWATIRVLVDIIIPRDDRSGSATDAERARVLDDIAWPAKAPPGLSHGVAFFNSFRDLTASGFWTSRMGIKDLAYQGNVFVPEWKGCPDEVLKKLGVV